MRSWSAAGALCASLLLASAARADNFEEFGFGPRAQAMAGAFTALSTDYTATYYNPAGLIFSRHLNLGFGFSFADYHLDFKSQRGGRDVDRRAERIPDLSAFTLGVSTTVPFDVPDRFAFGLGLFLPTRGLVNIDARSPSAEPEWFRYGARHDRVHILPSVAVKVTDWLSLGGGASIFVDAAGGTTLSAGIGTPVQPDFKLKLKPDAAPVFGLMLTPSDWLSLGLTYRGELSFKLDFPATAVVQGIAIPLKLETITFFTPHQLQAGAAINVTDRLLLALDLLWANWSAYDDAYLVVTSDVAQTPTRVRVDLRDTLSPRLGAEFAATDWLLLRGGYAYRTSAVPDQRRRPTNLVDSDKHTFTLGCGFAWGRAPERVSDAAQTGGGKAQTIQELTRDASYDLDLFFQLHWHPTIKQDKPATDPVGDWEAGGVIVNFGFAFTARF
ncbi:MAG: outer membrane protein transport protein [Planctomycetes bacterium]|nr:outer membrane protein transport protein [Planctomycetota bacterium]